MLARLNKSQILLLGLMLGFMLATAVYAAMRQNWQGVGLTLALTGCLIGGAHLTARSTPPPRTARSDCGKGG